MTLQTHRNDARASKYILLISIHGLIRGQSPELGRDADTGGQVKYVLELARALGQHPQVGRVDLLTRYILDPTVDADYSQPQEVLAPGVNLIRIKCGGDHYIPKEALWDHLDNYVDNTLAYLADQPRKPDIIHSHYADAGYVGTRLANLLGIPLVHTSHSLGRIKRQRLLASGMKPAEIETRYTITRRINAEEETLATANLIIASTHQEINDQYSFYDYNQPQKMQVVPPGIDLKAFYPPLGTEWESPIAQELGQFLREPHKPIILALARLDKRKNVISLVEAYGASPRLQELANLVIFVGVRDDINDLPSEAQGIMLELLTAIDTHNLYGKVAYPKRLASDDLTTVFRLAALSGGVFVNPALTEPFGLTLIEAAASGLPIVATEDGGPLDIVGNCQNGYLINPLDSTDIADKILKVLEDPATHKTLVENGLRGVKAHYAWESHVDEYLQALDALLIPQPTPALALPSRPPIRYSRGAIVTGIDQILVGDREKLQEFVALLRQHRQRIAFCVATGRRLDAALRLLNQHRIPQPDVLISSVGTEIHYAPDFTQDIAWRSHIDYRWTPNAVRRVLAAVPGLKLQPKGEQNEFKISYFHDAALAPSLEEIQSLLLQNDLTVNVQLGFGQYLDIVPIRASKWYALRWFVEQWNIPLENVLTVGATGMDRDLMRGNTLSVVVVGNHDEELADLMGTEPIWFSEQGFAAGILDGLAHYDFFRRCEGVTPSVEVAV